MKKQATRAVWGGEETYLMEAVTQVPVVHSVSFGYRDLDQDHLAEVGTLHRHRRGEEPSVRGALGGEELQDQQHEEYGADESERISAGDLVADCAMQLRDLGRRHRRGRGGHRDADRTNPRRGRPAGRPGAARSRIFRATTARRWGWWRWLR